MPRKKTTPPATASAADNSGFDVPPSTPTSTAPVAAAPSPAQPEPGEELATTAAGTPPAQQPPKPSPVNTTPLVIVPKQSFLRMQKLQTAKARQEQLRILARKHPVVRDLIKQLKQS